MKLRALAGVADMNRVRGRFGGDGPRDDAALGSPDAAPVSIRIRLSSLWVSVMFCFIYADYFELYIPNTLIPPEINSLIPPLLARR
jgi:hypothetical protein